MDKIKKVFSPGSNKDDDVMYEGGQYGASTNVPHPSESKPSDSSQLVTDPETDKKSHGVFRQIFNPQGEKYSEQSYGRTASLSEDQEPPRAGSLQTKPAGEGGGVMRQILNPNGEKYSEQSHGTTATQVPETQGSTGADRIATAGPSSTTAAQTSTGDSTQWRNETLAGIGAAGATGSAGALASERSQTRPDGGDVSNYDTREGVVPIDASHQDIQNPSMMDSSARFGPHVPGEFPTETGEDPHLPGAFPITPAEEVDRGIGSNATIAAGPGVGAGSAVGSGVLGAEAVQPSDNARNATLNNDALRSPPTAAEPQSHLGRDVGIVGGATAASGAAGYGLYEATKRDEPQAEAYQHEQPQDQAVPSTTTTQPTTTQAQPEHRYGRDAAVAGGVVGTGAAGYGLYEATKSEEPQYERPQERSVPETTMQKTADPKSREVDDQHHYGRDTAIAGAGTGAAGYGIYEGTKGKESQADTYQYQSSGNQTVPHTTTDKPTDKPTTTVEPSTTEQEPEHHYGRDAAVAGGVAGTGAAGYGIYQATQGSKEDTGPASKTIGPHESNVANVLDPRVKPEPEKMKKESTTTGPYKSDMANRADPRVQSKPSKTPETKPEENSYSREATTATGAAGAGAIGAGAYEASKDRDTPTPTESSRQSYESPNNKTSVDSRGHHHLHKKSVEQQGEKKPGLVSRILHPSRTKQEREEREAQRRSLERPTSSEDAQQTDSHIGTDGQIGDSSHASGMERSAQMTGENDFADRTR